MSNAVNSFSVLHNNPFLFGPMFPAFASELGDKKNAILLAYLVLPFCLHSKSRTFLERANVKSSIRTLLSDRERFHGLDERIRDLTEMSNKSLQYAIDVGALLIDSELSIAVGEPWPDTIIVEPGAIKAAKRLGILFSPYDVPTIYRMLGIQKI
ncbi:MAG: three component ABC system middle component [Sedimenticola sp.]